jgi:hypothetical protein
MIFDPQRQLRSLLIKSAAELCLGRRDQGIQLAQITASVDFRVATLSQSWLSNASSTRSGESHELPGMGIISY